MNEKVKDRLIAGGFIVGGIVLFYLATRGDAPTPAGNSLSVGGSTYGPPSSVTTNSPGGLTYNAAGDNIPALAGFVPPSVTLPGSDDGGHGDCCCGCDPNSGVNGFATSVTGALNTYASQLGGLISQSESALASQIPAAIVPYLTISDPNATSALNG